MKSLKNRHFGMDLVRVIAVLTVLIGHALIFFPQFFRVQWLLFLAVFGVELFFSLSGFLIGNILIKMARKNIDFKDVVYFWLKRWLRTIPVYLVIAIATMIVIKEIHWSYVLFLQNYFPEQLQDFQVSWSLTVEEWFYLTFPLLMYGLEKMAHLLKLKKSSVVLLSIMLFITIPLILRLLSINEDGHWDMAIRKQIHFRLDAIAYGVLLAYFYQHNKTIFLQKTHSFKLAILLLLGFAGLWWLSNLMINIFTAQPNIFNNVIFYPLINIYSTVFVAFCIRFKDYSDIKYEKVIFFISLISYSLYLVHFPIYYWFTGHVYSVASAFFYLIIAIICIFIAGSVLYSSVERPFINMRDKWLSGAKYSAV